MMISSGRVSTIQDISLKMLFTHRYLSLVGFGLGFFFDTKYPILLNLFWQTDTEVIFTFPFDMTIEKNQIWSNSC